LVSSPLPHAADRDTDMLVAQTAMEQFTIEKVGPDSPQPLAELAL
jgi:hypothetical protein